MHLKIVTFVPEELEEIEHRLRSIFPGALLKCEYFYPVIPTPDEIWEEIGPEVLRRLEKLPHSVQVLDLPLPQLLETLLYENPPTLLVVIYRQFSPRVAEFILPLMAKNYPLLIISL